MIISIQQLEHFPWIGFFNKMAQTHCFVLLDNVQFKKNYFENRNRIKTPQGWTWITVPVFIQGRFGQKINEVEINNNKNWKKKYLKTIEQNYRKARYYNDLKIFIMPAFEENFKKLSELNLDLIYRIYQYLELETELVLSSNLNIEGLSSSELLLEICKKFYSNTYISGPDGRNYLNKAIFSDTGIKIAYHDFKHPEYPQLYGEFISHLSVLDLIANLGKKSVSLIRECYSISYS